MARYILEPQNEASTLGGMKASLIPVLTSAEADFVSAKEKQFPTLLISTCKEEELQNYFPHPTGRQGILQHSAQEKKNTPFSPSLIVPPTLCNVLLFNNCFIYQFYCIIYVVSHLEWS